MLKNKAIDLQENAPGKIAGYPTFAPLKPFSEKTSALIELSKVVIMFNPAKFQKIDSYVSALCIGALASLSFWFLIIGSLLGIVFGQQDTTPADPIHPVHYVHTVRNI